MIVFIVILPLFISLFIPLFGMINRKSAFYVALSGAILTFLLIVSTLKRVLLYGREFYWFGGYEPPYGIEYVVDGLSLTLLIIISSVYLLVIIYSKKSLEKEIEEKRIALFYCLLNLFFTGILGIVITGDIFNLYVFVEIASLSSYTLIAMGNKRQSLMASYNYLILGTIGATFFLIGVGYLFMATGSLNMADIKLRLVPLYHSKMVRTAFAFLTLGLSLKLALFPLHIWLPNAYTYAPSPVGALLAATGTKVSAYALIRILYSVFTIEFDINVIPFNKVFVFISLVAILAGSFLALSQKNLKKMLAYSSVGQIGYITLGLAMGNEIALQGSILHIFNHSLMKGCLFFIAGGLLYKRGIENISDMKGIAKEMPFTMALFVIAGLSLVGVPLTVGFLSKWYLLLGAFSLNNFLVISVIVISSTLSLIYIWRIIEIAYFKEKDLPQSVSEMPLSMLIPTGILALLCLFFGVITDLPLALSRDAVKILIGH